MAKKIKITRSFSGYLCERCRHKWVPRRKTRPRICPKCKTTWWDTPKK